MNIGFIVGKDEETYNDKNLKKIVKKKHLVYNQLQSDVAIALTIQESYPDINVDIILPKEITKSRLQKNDVNFILGYDFNSILNEDPYVEKFNKNTMKGIAELLYLYSDESCKVFPPIKHLQFILNKKKYLTKLHKNNVPISQSIFFKRKNKLLNLINQVKDNKWKIFIIKPNGGTVSIGFKKFIVKDCLKNISILKNYLDENELYDEFIIQEFISGFRTYGEIKMFWINNKYSYAVNTIDKGNDNYQVKNIINKNVLNDCKEIGEKAINLVPPIIINKKKVLPVLLRTDFTCCLNNNEKSKKYFLNEIEYQLCGSYINYSNIKYPYVPVIADAFVKKAQELIDLGF